MKHPKILEWECRIKAMFDEIDDWLEDHYGQDYPLHPNRCQRGLTANKEMDGLFNIGADFTPGYGSQTGRGYVIRVRMSTLEKVPKNVRKCIESDVEKIVRQKLPRAFPHRSLDVKRDGLQLKITGNFQLGSAIVE